MTEDFYKFDETNFQSENDLSIKNENFISNSTDFLEKFANKTEKIEFSDLIFLLKILENHSVEFEEIIKNSEVLQHLIYVFPMFTTLNERLLCLQIFKILFINYSFDIESVIDESFFESIVSYFSDDPVGPFSIKFPSTADGKEQNKYERLLLDIFLTLVKKYPILQDKFDKTYFYDVFSPYIIRTTDFDIFNSTILWIASILNPEEDSYESTTSLLQIFTLLEPYFNEKECKPLLILANEYCSISNDCCDAFNEVFPICNLFSSITKDFLYMKELFILINTIIYHYPHYDDILFHTLDINIIMNTLVYANYIDYEQENPTKFIISFILFYLTKDNKNKKNMLNILNNSNIINGLMDDSRVFNDKIDRFSLVLLIWNQLEFEERCSFFDEICSNNFMNCIEFLLQTGDIDIYMLSLDTLLLLHTTFFDNETRFDYSEIIDNVNDLQEEFTEKNHNLSNKEMQFLEKCEIFLQSFNQ